MFHALRRVLSATPLGIALTLAAPWAAAAEHADPLAAIDEEDRPAVQALATYPADLRRAALVVATRPDLLLRLDAEQEKSQRAFRELLAPYSEAEREALFRLTARPGIVEDLVRVGPDDLEAIDAVVAGLPDDLRGDARDVARRHPTVLARVHALLVDQRAFLEELVSGLPAETGAAFFALDEAPELLAMLTGSPRLAVLLGDAYERDPDGLEARLDALQLELAESAAAEGQVLTEQLAEDAELRRELAAYEAEQGTSPYHVPSAPSHRVVAYSFWVGVPWWYATRYATYDPWVYWYPRPYWTGWGLWFGPRLAIHPHHVHRLPSPRFWHWYALRPHRHHHVTRIYHAPSWRRYGPFDPRRLHRFEPRHDWRDRYERRDWSDRRERRDHRVERHERRDHRVERHERRDHRVDRRDRRVERTTRPRAERGSLRRDRREAQPRRVRAERRPARAEADVPSGPRRVARTDRPGRAQREVARTDRPGRAQREVARTDRPGRAEQRVARTERPRRVERGVARTDRAGPAARRRDRVDAPESAPRRVERARRPERVVSGEAPRRSARAERRTVPPRAARPDRDARVARREQPRAAEARPQRSAKRVTEPRRARPDGRAKKADRVRPAQAGKQTRAKGPARREARAASQRSGGEAKRAKRRTRGAESSSNEGRRRKR